MSEEFRIKVSDESLTGSDIVGRAVRTARLNWLPLMRFFISPIFVYGLAEYFIAFDELYFDFTFSPTTSFWIWLISYVILCLSTWELGMRRFALLQFIGGHVPSLHEGLALARRRMILVLVIMLPVMASDTLSIAFFALVRLFHHALVSSSVPIVIRAQVDLLNACLILLMMLPDILVWVLNAFFMSIVVEESNSLQNAARRFFEVMSATFGLSCAYILLMCSTYFSTLFTTFLLLPIDFFMPHNLVSGIIQQFIGALIDAPIYAFLSICTTIGGAFLYRQICYRLDGKDILEKLAKLGGNLASRA